ncbi:MAG: hypothetical protein EZS28_004217 [Streblomastix strix]|uniref:Uncharacterized protein n=1 Tax=Streblomastix strix TaxID=222440 RepID=A0A5J4WYR2_9EUKA|nr:MAG: hypothetical protein EZS28_004217 [Streblomastix strix]
MVCVNKKDRFSQDIGQLQADVSVINTELARQTHFRGYFITNDEILALKDVSKGDYAYNAEDLQVWVYDTIWYETDQIVPDQVTPASELKPQELVVSVPTVIQQQDTATGEEGTANSYARSDHTHHVNLSNGVPQKDSRIGTAGTSNIYSSATHQHPLNVDPSSANVPLVNATAATNGTSDYYCRNDHVHLQQLTYDGNVTATKFIKTGGTDNDILLADGTTKKSSFSNCDPNSSTGTLSDQWNIAVTADGQFKIGLGSQAVQDNKGLMISADGNTLSFNGSVIAGTGASTGASNGSVNYSAGNPIVWGTNSTGTDGGFYSNGTNIFWRGHALQFDPCYQER